LSLCSTEDPRLFLQFSLDVNIDGEIKKLVGFGHPRLIQYIAYNKVHIFIDCTFSMCPKGFYQCLIIMIYVLGLEKYIPVFFCLLPNKKEV
jgi:hypothetical protein